MACCSAAVEVSTKHTKKKVRRRKRRKKRNGHTVDSRNCHILYANINGFKSKADSYNQIVVEQNIDIHHTCETKVYRRILHFKLMASSHVLSWDRKTLGEVFILALDMAYVSQSWVNMVKIQYLLQLEWTGFEVNPSLWSSGKGTGGKIELNFIKNYQLK